MAHYSEQYPYPRYARSRKRKQKREKLVTQERVLDTVLTLHALGEPVSVRRVRGILGGGSMRDVARSLKQLREQGVLEPSLLPKHAPPSQPSTVQYRRVMLGPPNGLMVVLERVESPSSSA